jgi:hypothetical protein
VLLSSSNTKLETRSYELDICYCVIENGAYILHRKYIPTGMKGQSVDKVMKISLEFIQKCSSCSLHHRVQNGSGAHPTSYSMGTGGLSLEVKRPGHETDNSPPSSAEVKNAWGHTSTTPIRLHGVVFSYKKAQGKFYLHLFSNCKLKTTSTLLQNF